MTRARTSGAIFAARERAQHVGRSAQRQDRRVLQHQREVDVRAGRFAEIVLANVLDHADDGFLQPEHVDRQALAERILSGPKTLGGRLRDDHVAGVLPLLVVGEVAPLQYLDAHRFEVVAGGERDCQRILRCALCGALLRRETGRENALVQRKVLHDTDRLHTGQAAQSLHEREVETRPRGPVSQLRLLGGELKREDVLRHVAGVDVAQLREAAQQQAGADQQQQRERRLRHDEAVASPTPAGSGAARACRAASSG